MTKEEAWTSLKSQMDVPDIKNPLPDTLHVKVISQEHVDSAVNEIKQLKGVEGVQYAQELAGKLRQVSNITNIATLTILISFSLAD
ncbi:MAG: permease-like cell division protein FtsX [Bacillus subtilis]|nr:permease-like cell division protein FtsX [Bacillus subtilis]